MGLEGPLLVTLQEGSGGGADNSVCYHVIKNSTPTGYFLHQTFMPSGCLDSAGFTHRNDEKTDEKKLIFLCAVSDKAEHHSVLLTDRLQ